MGLVGSRPRFSAVVTALTPIQPVYMRRSPDGRTDVPELARGRLLLSRERADFLGIPETRPTSFGDAPPQAKILMCGHKVAISKMAKLLPVAVRQRIAWCSVFLPLTAKASSTPHVFGGLLNKPKPVAFAGDHGKALLVFGTPGQNLNGVGIMPHSRRGCGQRLEAVDTVLCCPAQGFEDRTGRLRECDITPPGGGPLRIRLPPYEKSVLPVGKGIPTPAWPRDKRHRHNPMTTWARVTSPVA